MSAESSLIIALNSISLVPSGSCVFSHMVIDICIFLQWIAYSIYFVQFLLCYVSF